MLNSLANARFTTLANMDETLFLTSQINRNLSGAGVTISTTKGVTIEFKKSLNCCLVYVFI